MNYEFLLLALILFTGMFLSVLLGKLTIPASLTGGLVGLLIFVGAGFTGLAMVAAVFVLSTLATSWKMGLKQGSGLAEVNKGRRKAAQVAANAGLAALFAALVWINNENAHLYRLLMAASLSSAIADTISSELGNVYGRNYYNVCTRRKDTRGLDGVVSIEGTVAGIAASTIIAMIYAVGFGLTVDCFWIVCAGTAGNFADSILGATLERKHYLNNNVVNFLNTVIAALTALAFSFFWS